MKCVFQRFESVGKITRSVQDAVYGFPVLPEVLVRCGRKIKHLLISYFFNNMSAKNY